MEHNKELNRLAKIAVSLTQEFTSPLNIMIDTLEDLNLKETDPKKQLQLRVAMRNGLKFRNFLSSIFNIAGHLSGTNVAKCTKLDMVSFTKNILDSFAPAATEKQVTLLFKSSVAELPSYVEYQMMHQIVYRLIANGIRFIKPEGGMVRLSLHYNKEHKELTLDVWDNGIGVVPEKLPHMFDINYNDDPIHLAFYQSTSMGLFLVKLLVEKMGGTIKVDSTKFEHTNFRVVLPVFLKRIDLPYNNLEFNEDLKIAELLNKEQVLRVDTDEILQIKKTKRTKPVILVVAQEQQLTFFSKMFADTAQLIFTHDADIGISHAITYAPDLIIAENEITDMTGAELISYLRKNQEVGHIAMVLCNCLPLAKTSKKEILDMEADMVIHDMKHPQLIRQELLNLIASRQRIFEAAKQRALEELKMEKDLSIDESFMAKLNGIIEKNINNEHFSVDMLSEQMYLSRTQIHRKITALAHQSTTQYINRYKLKKALRDIEDHTGSISEIAYKYGYSSPAYFSRLFFEVYGKLPSEITRNEN